MTLRRAVSEEEKGQRRDTILAAAKEVFAAKGYHATTIADVARAADLSYGAIYWYFDAKEDLFHALMADEEESLREAITGGLSVAAGASLDEILRQAVRSTFEFFESDRAATRLLFRDSYALGDPFERHLSGIYERFIADLESVVAAAQDEGLIRPVPPHMVAFSAAALIGQIALRRLSTDDGLAASVVADFVVDLLFDGLRPR